MYGAMNQGFHAPQLASCSNNSLTRNPVSRNLHTSPSCDPGLDHNTYCGESGESDDGWS
jgi:hypothetical protein